LDHQKEKEKTQKKATKGHGGPDWTTVVENAASCLSRAVQVDMGSMWRLGVVEESFLLLFCKGAYDLIRSPAAVKSAFLKGCAFQLVGHVCRQQPAMSASVVTALFDLINNHEHAGLLVAELLQSMQRSFGTTQIAVDVLHEVGRMSKKECMGSKYVASFLTEISPLLPTVVLSNIALLLPHLDGESYHMRSAILGAIGFIVSSELSNRKRQERFESSLHNGENETDPQEVLHANRKTRDTLLNILQDRVHDVSSFTRSSVLKVWSMLVETGSVPISRWHLVTALAADRLHDRTVLVRRGAIVLLRTVLEHNPYSIDGKLVPEHYESKVKELRDWIEQHSKLQMAMAEDESESTDSADSENVKSNKADQSLLADSTDDVVTDEQALALKLQTLEEKDREIKCRVRLLKFHQSALQFIEQLTGIIPDLCQMLGSKNSSDVMASLRFFVRAHFFALPHAEQGIKKAITLIWSHEESVKEEVLNTLQELYILVPGTDGKKHQPPMVVATHFVNLVQGASLAQIASMEHAISCMIEKEMLSFAVINKIPEIIANSSLSVDCRRGAMCILGMIGTKVVTSLA
jgi:condensin complex subunit 1